MLKATKPFCKMQLLCVLLINLLKLGLDVRSSHLFTKLCVVMFSLSRF